MRRYDKISTYFSLNKKSFLIATVTGVIFNGLMAFVPLIQGKLIDCYKAQKDARYIVFFAVSFLAFVVFIQINRFLKRYFVRDFANRMILQMRMVSFQNLIHDDMSSFLNTSKGDIMNKNLSDILDSAEGVRKILTEVYDSIILLLGYLISMFIMDKIITLIITSFLVVSVLFASVMKKLIYNATKEFKKTFSKSKDVTLNALDNEIYFRGFGVSSKYYKKFENVQDEVEKKQVKSMILKSSLEPTYKGIALIGVFFVIYMCGIKVIDGAWLIGSFSAYLTTFVLVSEKTSKVGKIFNAFASLKVSWKRASTYLVSSTNQNDVKETSDKLSLEVNNLSFGFDESFKVKNITFSVNETQAIGICGMIHSGKSTLAAALTGLYDYEGSLKLNNIELREVKNKSLKGFISYAPSNVEIFSDTIKYNICFSDAKVTKELKMACFSDEVDSFIDKENTTLTHTVSNLSGGQQKRLQIARGLYNEPKLIIMDDPFNAIDLEMSMRIIHNILNNYKNSILILVTNQPEILKEMDHLIFLKNDSYKYLTFNELLTDNDFVNLMGGKLK